MIPQFYLVLHLAFITWGQNVAYSSTSIPMNDESSCKHSMESWLRDHTASTWNNIPSSKAECIPTGF